MANIIKQATDYLDHENKKKLLYISSGIFCGSLLTWKLSQYYKHRKFKAACGKIGARRDEKIYNLKQKLASYNQDPDRVSYITKLSLAKLSEELKSGKLTAVEVLQCYQRVAVEAHDDINCLTEVFSEADGWAKELDARGNKSGILFGIPVSIKDNIPTKGHLNSRGCLRHCDKVGTEDCLLVKLLKSQGAVPFVKTNVPQLLMGVESSNALYGVTCNPHDHTRTPGGSSGGEGAILGAGASILGIGTDIGGSVRIPASHCGICSLKTTSHRLSSKGMIQSGQRVIRTCLGPMARDVDSLVIAMKALLTPQMFNEDKMIPPMHFNDEVFQGEQKLTIGYYVDDTVVPATPSMARAVNETKAILEARGHTLVPWTPPEMFSVIEYVVRAYSGDRGCHFACKFANWMGEPGLARCLRGFRGYGSIMEWFDYTLAVQRYSERFQADWKQNKLDAVICPSFTHQAPKLGSTLKMPFVHVGYCSLYNLLDYSAGIVPVTKVTASDIEQSQQYAKKEPKPTIKYLVEDIADSEGHPITVQCVTPMFREELCLRLMKEVENGVKEKSGFYIKTE